MNRPAQAAAAAHTFFVANPAHQEMRQNLEYYQAMAGVRQDDFTDLEAKPHLVRPPLPAAGNLPPKPLGRSQHDCWLSKRVRCHLGTGGLSPAHRDTVPRVFCHLNLSAPHPKFLTPPQAEFRLGVRFYTEEQPAAAVLHLEKALGEYFVADAECRALCEGPYDYEGYNYLEYNADLFQAITGGSCGTILRGDGPQTPGGWWVPIESKPYRRECGQ